MRILRAVYNRAMEGLLRGQVDCAAVTTPCPVRKSLQETALVSFREILICGSDFHDLTAETQSLRDLENLPFVCMSRGTSTYTFYQQLFLKHNLAFHVEMEAGTMDQVLAMVQSNLGVGFYPESMAASALAAGTVFQIRLAEPIPERFVNLIEDTSRPQSVAMKAFKKMLLAPEEE